MQTDSTETKNRIAYIIISWFLGYFRHLFLSWSFSIAIFLCILPIGLTLPFLFWLADQLWPGFSNQFMQSALGMFILDSYLWFFKDWAAHIKYLASGAIIILPMFSLLLSHFFKNIAEIVDRIHKKFLWWAAVLSIFFLSFIISISDESAGSKIASVILIALFFLAAKGISRFLYVISTYLHPKPLGKMQNN